MHDVDTDHSRHRLKVIGYGCGGASEIIPVIGQSQVQIKISRQAKAVSVLEFVLEFALLAETAAMIQIALKNVTGINLEKIAWNGLFRPVGRGDGGVSPLPPFQPKFDK